MHATTDTSKLFVPQHAADESELGELMDLAMDIESDPLSAINALINGLLVKHADDDGTTSALMAIQGYHLLNLVDSFAAAPEVAQH
jgi:hypothetical protein